MLCCILGTRVLNYFLEIRTFVIESKRTIVLFDSDSAVHNQSLDFYLLKSNSFCLGEHAFSKTQMLPCLRVPLTNLNYRTVDPKLPDNSTWTLIDLWTMSITAGQTKSKKSKDDV
jgi:hypothetical protein